MAIKHFTIKTPGQKLFAVADWNADHTFNQTDINHNLILNTHNLTTDINHNLILNTHNLTTDINHNLILNTHNLTTDINHNLILNTHNLTTDINHNLLTNYSAARHFLESEISHLNILNIGTNTHAQIDTAITNSVNHIAGTGTTVHGDSFLLNTGDVLNGNYWINGDFYFAGSSQLQFQYSIIAEDIHDTDALSICAHSTESLYLGDTATARMILFPNGNVYIGTTSANGRLSVRGSTTDSTAYAFEAANSAGNTMFIVRNDGQHSFYGADLAEKVRIDNTGNVGIGKSPDYKLDVNGTSNMTGFRMPTGATSGYALISDAAGVGTWQAVTPVGGGWTDDGVIVRLTTITDKVGIGTANPLSKLSVGANGESNVGIFGYKETLPPLYAGVGVEGQSDRGVVGIGTYTGVYGYGGEVGLSAWGGIYNLFCANDLAKSYFAGSVGIGVDPEYKLDVSGQMHSTNGRKPSGFLHGVNKTHNEIFDTIAPNIPNTNDEMILNGIMYSEGPLTIVTSYVKRTAANTITIYGLTSTGGLLMGLVITDGGGSVLNVSLAW